MLLALLFGGLTIQAPDADQLAPAMLDAVTYQSTRHREHPKRVAHCRAVDCEARMETFAALIIRYAERYQLDPWTLAAMAKQESGYNPMATGGAGEFGLFQIHPRNRMATRPEVSRFLRDDRHRERCAVTVDACQKPIVRAAAELLASSIAKCGSIEAGLGMYNTGTCDPSARYVGAVAMQRRDLIARAEKIAAEES